MIGRTLSNYKITGKIGEGGMGEVYQAIDTILHREVAVKLLPMRFSTDLERVSRFEREATTLAKLQHANIASIYGFGQDGDHRFLVMELVEGEDLAERLSRGALPVREALEISGQIAEALDQAHHEKIIHRDLKPANIRVTKGGGVKVLDFGLAKILTGQPIVDQSGDASTLPALQTQLGTVMGTPAYMSPEQTKGLEADEHSDLWALGCCLFEMLTQTSAFGGNSYAETVAAVLAKEPAWGLLPEETPARVRRLIGACLTKDPGERMWSAHDFRDEVRRAATMLNSDIMTAVSVGTLPQLQQLTYSVSLEEAPAWSPKEDDLLYTRQVGSVRKIFRHRIETGESFPITRGPHDDLMPTWHPNGESVLFVRSRASGQKLEPGDVFGTYPKTQEGGGDVWRVDLKSGQETMLVEGAYNPALSPDGKHIAVDTCLAGPSRIWLLDSQGRNPRQLTTDTSEAVDHIRPRWSPDGKKIVFQNIERTQFDIRCIDIPTQKMTWISRDLIMDVHPVWAPDGNAVYFTSYRSGGMNVWRVAVDAAAEPVGPLHQVTAGPGQDLDLTFSPGGTQMAFSILRQNADLWKLPVSPETGVPRGQPEAVVVSTREDSRGAWSPDDTRIAFNSNRTGDMNLWLFELESDSLKRITVGTGGDYQPNWSPDGQSFAFFSSRGGNTGLWRVDVLGGEPVSLSPLNTVEVNPSFSPDGTRIAYQSDRDGRLELWVMGSDGSDCRKLTRCGVIGHFVRWSHDGNWIYFRCGTGNQTVHRIAASGGEPEELPLVRGGSHLSLSPEETHIADVLGHKELWVSPIAKGEAHKVFEFDDPDARIDYPVWSNDGRWILFDRFLPQGGDIWLMETPEA